MYKLDLSPAEFDLLARALFRLQVADRKALETAGGSEAAMIGQRRAPLAALRAKLNATEEGGR